MYSDEYFKKKYFKYKMKYLGLKNTYLNIEMKGGDKPVLTNDNINLFNPTLDSHKLMEPYLNPVYGLYMCESGFISNHFYLYSTFKASVSEYNNYGQKIVNLSRSLDDEIKPNKKVYTINSTNIGRYIALLYICKNNTNFITTNTNGVLYAVQMTSFSKEQKNLLKIHIDTLNNYIINTNIPVIKTTFPINNCSKMEDIDFHIILYCLWWVLNDDNGIIGYYTGINEVINICNEILSWHRAALKLHEVKYDPIIIGYINDESDGFEKLALDITKKSFHKYEMQYPHHLCSKITPPTYPDCGEITARNLINLICFDPETGKFNIKILQQYKPIDELITYYTIFNTFAKQSSANEVPIYEKELNAKDAWSILIINFANYNLRFNKFCDDETKYELEGGMAKDSTTTNFFQLIKNLLGINEWDELNTDDIFQIESTNINGEGVGEIVINVRDYGIITIKCEEEHYSMEINKEATNHDITGFTDPKLTKLNILLNKQIVTHNLLHFLWINWSSELLVEIINDDYINIDLKKKLLELSFTDKFTSETRLRIKINTKDDNGFFTYFVNKFGLDKKINEYTYKSKNFDFVTRLPQLIHLNCVIDSYISEITLRPLSNILTIGNKFLKRCYNLTNIDLQYLSNVTSIGNKFLSNCHNLTNIDLQYLSKVISIGNGFLSKCFNLTTINLEPLSNITLINDNFLSHCNKLTEIDLKPLSNVISIGDNFLSYCKDLTNIDLKYVSNVKSIGNDFLKRSDKLRNIDLNPLSNVQSIGDNFLSECGFLTEIKLNLLSNLISIGRNFLRRCFRLHNIEFPHELKVTQISDNFLQSCINLKSINLQFLLNVISIKNGFLSECNKLTEIDLTQLLNVISIGDHFLYECSQLENINLTSLSKVTSIGSDFMSKCAQLKEIDLNPLEKVKSIGNNFLSECTNLEKIILSNPLQLISGGEKFCDMCTSLTFINETRIPDGESLNKYIFELVESV